VTIDELCERHRRIAVDANVLIYLLEGDERRGPAAKALMKAVENGRVAAVLSAVGLAEVLAGPARDDQAHVERYNDEIRSIAGLKIVPFEAEVSSDAAVIRGVRRIGLADAIHLASARAAGATAFVTNDRTLRGSAKLEVVYLDDLEAEPTTA
jgi:predicted nucleic acid-binding protein